MLLFFWGYIVTFTKVLTIHHSWIHPLHHSHLSYLPNSHFSIFIHEYLIFTVHSASYTLSLYPSTHCYQPPNKTILPFYSLLLKKRDFFLFTIVIQGISLRHFHAQAELVHLYFSLFYFIPYIMVISTSLKILYSFLYRRYINHIHLLNLFLLPSLSHE
jgi:hypothetical protein